MTDKCIKTLIFDFGNVIGFFDYTPALQRLEKEAGITPQQVRSLLLDTGLEHDYESGRISTADFLSRFRQTCKVPWSDDELTLVYADIFSPNHEVCALLPELKLRYRLLLASNTNEMHSRQFLRQFAETLHLFDALILSHQVGARKPAAAFYEHCQRFAECAPQQCLFIDDLPENIAAAQVCGWNGIVYTGYDSFRSGLRKHGVLDERLTTS